MTYWLIAGETLAELERVRATPTTAEQRSRFEAARRGARRGAGELPPNLTVNGSEATIAIEGILTEAFDFWAWILGMPQTSYSDIRSAVDAVMRDPAIRSVTVAVDSPGGQLDGLF